MTKEWTLVAQRSDVTTLRHIVRLVGISESSALGTLKALVDLMEDAGEWPEGFDAILHCSDGRDFLLESSWTLLNEILFYVPDYPKVKHDLLRAYERFGIEEWSAEPGEVRGCPNDADVRVQGPQPGLDAFAVWLKRQKIKGSIIDGIEVCTANDIRKEVHCCPEHRCGWCHECRDIPG